MIEQDVIQSKLRFLREYLHDLSGYRDITIAEYVKHKKDQRFVERTLHLSCECCIDIAANLISRNNFRPPKNNKDLFLIIHENAIISEPVYLAMRKMAMFRNIILYDYARIDPEIVIDILNRDVEDFNRFASEILDFLFQKYGM